MAQFVTCPTCGAENQEVGKFCEQCGTKITSISVPLSALNNNSASVASAPPPVLRASDVDDDPLAALDVAVVADPPVVANNAPVESPPVAAIFDTPTPPAEPAPRGADAPTTEDAPPATPASSDDPLAPLRFVRVENGAMNYAHSFPIQPGGSVLIGRTDPANGVFPDVDVTMWSQRVNTADGALYTIHRKQCVISRDAQGQVWIKDWEGYEGDTMVSLVGTAQFRPIPSLTKERPSNDSGALGLQIGDRILMGQAEGMLIFLLVQES